MERMCLHYLELSKTVGADVEKECDNIRNLIKKLESETKSEVSFLENCKAKNLKLYSSSAEFLSERFSLLDKIRLLLENHLKESSVPTFSELRDNNIAITEATNNLVLDEKHSNPTESSSRAHVSIPLEGLKADNNNFNTSCSEDTNKIATIKTSHCVSATGPNPSLIQSSNHSQDAMRIPVSLSPYRPPPIFSLQNIQYDIPVNDSHHEDSVQTNLDESIQIYQEDSVYNNPDKSVQSHHENNAHDLDLSTCSHHENEVNHLSYKEVSDHQQTSNVSLGEGSVIKMRSVLWEYPLSYENIDRTHLVEITSEDAVALKEIGKPVNIADEDNEENSTKETIIPVASGKKDSPDRFKRRSVAEDLSYNLEKSNNAVVKSVKEDVSSSTKMAVNLVKSIDSSIPLGKLENAPEGMISPSYNIEKPKNTVVESNKNDISSFTKMAVNPVTSKDSSIPLGKSENAPVGISPFDLKDPVIGNERISINDFHPVQIATYTAFDEIYVHLQSMEDDVEVITKNLNKAVRTATKCKGIPNIGDYVAARWTDETWYRAKVVKLLDHERCRVLFCDYGNRCDLPISDLCYVDASFFRPPFYVIHLILDETEAIDHVGIVDFMRKRVDEDMRAVFHDAWKFTEIWHMVGKLYGENDDNLARKMLAERLVTKSKRKLPNVEVFGWGDCSNVDVR